MKEPPGQPLAGTVIVTCCGCPGESVPLGGLKVTPLKSLDADQFRLPCEPGASVNVSVHVALPLLSVGQLPPGLTVSVGGTQLHVAVTVFASPVKMKLPPVHSLLGIKMLTCIL